MARQYLAEGLKGSFPFFPDTTKTVVENLSNGQTRTRIPGRFSVCDAINGNNRRYGRKVWEKNFQPGSSLMTSIAENAAFGLLEHPKDGQVTLQSPICILTTGAKLQEGKDASGKSVWEVVGEISILNPERVPESNRLLAMIEAGYNPRVSSRGFGSLIRNESDGVDDVQDDYICEGWDVVMKPSFESAVLQPDRKDEAKPKTESVAAPATAPLTETAPAVTTASSGPPITITAPVAPPAAPPAPAQKINESKPKIMNSSDIRSQINSFRGVDPRTLSPKRFAEGMAAMTALHNEIASYLSEDTKRSWEAGQLHDEIKGIEEAWSATQLAPGKKASKLQEDNTKLMQVCKATAQTALTLKRKVGESAKAQTRQTALLSEVTSRGQAWRQRAKELEQESAKFQRRFMMASEALNQLAAKYKADVTQMGKAHLNLEFKEKITAPEFQAMIKEAQKPKALVPVRLALEGKITVETAQGILKGKISLDETLKGLKSATPSGTQPVTEGKTTPAAPAAGGKTDGTPAAPAAAPVTEGVKIISAKPGDPRSLTEAVGMVSRLSKASA